MRLAPLALALLLAAGPAHAEGERPATGLLLQSVLGVQGSVIGATQLGSFVSLAPSVRLGGIWERFALSASLGYSSVGVLDGQYVATHSLILGPHAMPFLWRSPDQRARLYLLGGLEFALGFDAGSGGSTKVRPGGAILLGLGGHYAVGRQLLVGVEVGWRTELFSGSLGGSNRLVATSNIYGGVSFAFVAGS